jgi:hypothetical protein
MTHHRAVTAEEWASLRRESLHRLPAGLDGKSLPDVLLPCQQALLATTAANRVTVVEKSRRTGFTRALGGDAVLVSAAARSAGGMDTLYIGYNLDMAREFVDVAAMWARLFHQAAGAVEEFLFDDGPDSGKTLRRKNRSSRKRRDAASSFRLRLVAAMTRTSILRLRLSPTRSICCSCRTRSSLACRSSRSSGNSPTSSRKIVPPARTGVADGAGDEFLSGAGFTGDQNRGAGGRDKLDLVQDGPHSGAVADQLRVVGVDAQLVLKVGILGFHAALQALHLGQRLPQLGLRLLLLGHVTKHHHRPEQPPVLLDRRAGVFDREAGPIAPPDHLIDDAVDLAVAEGGVDRARLDVVVAAVLVAVMNDAVHSAADQFLAAPAEHDPSAHNPARSAEEAGSRQSARGENPCSCSGKESDSPELDQPLLGQAPSCARFVSQL